MKEKIYTIPLSEAYETDCECPLCELEKKIEAECVSYVLGAAMMEPDFRIISNDKGYCNKHFSMMFNSSNKLSLALVLDTHLDEVIGKLKKNSNFKLQKKGIFKKKSLDTENTAFLKNITDTCVVCEKVNSEMERYIDVFFGLWDDEDDFRKKVLSSKGFCLKHFERLIAGASNTKNPEEFISKLYSLELENLKRLKEDIHRFTLKFDYRNKDMEWGTAVDAPKRLIEKLEGYIKEEKE